MPAALAHDAPPQEGTMPRGRVGCPHDELDPVRHGRAPLSFRTAQQPAIAEMAILDHAGGHQVLTPDETPIETEVVIDAFKIGDGARG